MWERVLRRRDDLADTLWLVPSLFTILAVALALTLVRIDEGVDLSDRAAGSPWLYGGGAEGARGVLSSIASTMIAVAATVFSITIVTLQLASSQFTPRVLRHFTGDRGVQLVLGVFIGTFTYSLLVMRAVHSESDDQQRFVPVISVSVGVLLALTAIGMLIYQIHHVARSIQAAIIVDRATVETIEAFDRAGAQPPDDPKDERTTLVGASTWPFRSESGMEVVSERGGYVLSVDVDRLLDWSADRKAPIRVLVIPGQFVLPGEAVLTVVAVDDLSDDDRSHLRGGVITGVERTMRGDPAFGVRQLSDIALKALSPGVNDPTTAQTCIDRLGEVMIRAAGSPLLDDRTHLQGEGRVSVAGLGFPDLLDAAYGQIRHYGASDATVMTHLVRSLGIVAGLIEPRLVEPLKEQARLALESARSTLTLSIDADRVAAQAAWATADGGGE